MTYFDFNATTPLSAPAREACLRAVDDAWQNPSSPHRAGARVHALLEAARERLAELLGCAPTEIVFTSGATEGNNAVLAHARCIGGAAASVAYSAVEHPCVRAAAEASFATGNRTIIPVSRDGVVDLAALEGLLGRARPTLVSVMAANNETGALQPWREAQALCARHGVLFHCDAAQWLGKLPAAGLGTCDFLTGCAHKFGGPKGVGFLKITERAGSFRSLLGGEQEHGHRAGTENFPGIAAMLAALESHETGPASQAAPQAARDRFLTELQARIPGTRVVAQRVPRLWNTAFLILPRHANTRWVSKLDKLGFAVSTGSACAAGKEEDSTVLGAMGYTADEVRRAVRVSGGWSTTDAEWEALATAFLQTWTALEAASGAGSTAATIIVP